MYYLGTDNCIYDSNQQNLNICNIYDFEVTVDKKFICIGDSKATATNNGVYTSIASGY